jgi:hypothetical protein
MAVRESPRSLYVTLAIAIAYPLYSERLSTTTRLVPSPELTLAARLHRI